MYSPRIYTYKITFEEVPYYYYGVHKEKVFGEEYWGSPVTNRWCWELYTPKKQILEFFDYTDDGWKESQKVEKRLIKKFYNTDKWCLNESVGGYSSISICSQNGLKSKENKVGIFSLTKEQLIEIGKKRGKENFENKIGFFAISKEERSKIGKKSGTKNYKEGIGLVAISKERKSEIGKKAAEKNKLNKVGIFSLTKEQMSENGKKNAIKNKKNKVGIFGMSLEKRREICRKVNSQKWKCLETGHITTAGPLTIYQKSRGIDTSKRERID
jgi:general stress protein YciG